MWSSSLNVVKVMWAYVELFSTYIKELVQRELKEGLKFLGVDSSLSPNFSFYLILSLDLSHWSNFEI